jgi:hypothetical protein
LEQFYLAIENTEIGLEDKFSQDRLRALLGMSSKHEIKVAFVSACQSEQIGEIFLKAGIPVVISVNADQEIMDRVCNLFSLQFYRYLLDGHTIRQSFNSARNMIKVSNEDFNTCCCAHEHDSDCPWYQLYLKDWKKAHLMHATPCSCPPGVNGKRLHKKTCIVYQEFREFISQTKNGDSAKKETKQATETMLPSLMDLNLDDSDDDFLIDDNFITKMEEIIPHDIDAQENIMCCCKKSLSHDETEKFKLKVSEDYKNREKDILDCTLFNQRKSGQLV